MTIALRKVKPGPMTFGHMSFHLPDKTALRKALAHLAEHLSGTLTGDGAIGGCWAWRR